MLASFLFHYCRLCLPISFHHFPLVFLATRQDSAMSKKKPVDAPFGSWESPITSEFVTGGNAKRIVELQLDSTNSGKDSVYWLEQTYPEGRGVIYQLIADLGPNHHPVAWTPHPLSCRNRVHEYGGCSFIVHAGIVYFTTVDFFYCQDRPDRVPDPLIPADSEMQFADSCYAHNSIYCVLEDHSLVSVGKSKEATNSLVRLQLQPANSIIVKVADGADFYASPKISPDGKKLVWMQWNHPNMPWDSTEIWLADVTENGQVLNGRKVLGNGKTNYVHPRWSLDGRLFCISDHSNWWNIYHVNVDTDMAGPHWQFGHQPYSFEMSGKGDRLTFTVSGELFLKEMSTEKTVKLNTGYSNHSYLTFGRDDCIYCIASGPLRHQAVIRYELGTDKTVIIHEVRDSCELDTRYISEPKELTFPTGDNDQEMCSGYFYAPKNPNFAAKEGEFPPALLLAHGGPTGQTNDALNLEYQYFTSRGFAVFDVNYRGSTGYGRKFRDQLHGQWGVSDLMDMCKAADFLAESGRADRKRLCIKGSSAGGYLVLRAVGVPHVFSVAVCLYGVSDLEALQKETHKFESMYETSLIAPFPERIDVYRDRSPINHLDQIHCPVAFFHGHDDKVVPPDQARRFYSAVLSVGLPTMLIEFEEEGHGFRRRQNVQLTIDGSYVYMCKVLAIEPSGDTSIETKIENLSPSNVK